LIVVDTNIIAYFLLPGEHSLAAERAFRKDPSWAAPLLWRSEFRNILAALSRRRIIDAATGLMIMEEAERLMDENEYMVDSAEVLALCGRSPCSGYDCEFAALARQFRIPLVTLDEAILSAFPENAVGLKKFLGRRGM
jgi:predicted nucleic acid-binding protein